jgi:hypothetical protein
MNGVSPGDLSHLMLDIHSCYEYKESLFEFHFSFNYKLLITLKLFLDQAQVFLHQSSRSRVEGSVMNQLKASKRLLSGLTTLVGLALSLLLACPSHGQVTGATLSGTVTDVSGGVVPQTQMSVKNLATGVTRAVTTDAAGFYSVPNLLPGTYEVTASAAGFATKVQTGITLTVGAKQVLNVTMQVGETTQEIKVTTEAPDVQLASSEISAVVNSRTVRELPLNGRSWTDLATLQPGVTAVETQQTAGLRGNRGFGNQISIAGGRPTQNNYRLDGISINDYSNGGPGSVLGGNLGVDAIAEFSILTTNYSAEYGRTSGGVVNAITRSGTNGFHGDMYEFLRNNALDARNFFDKKIPPFRRNQFGVSAGAPIRKDRLFVFGDYEGIRQSKGLTSVVTVPSPAARSGILCSAPDTTPACTPTTITVDPSAQKYLPFWPLPNSGIKHGTNGDRAIFTFAPQQIVTENFVTIRVDDKFSDKDSLAATYVGDKTPQTQPNAIGNIINDTVTNRYIGILEETHTFSPTLVNSARVGYSRESALNNLPLTAINPVAADHSLAAVPGLFPAAVTVGGMNASGGGLKASDQEYNWNSFQVYDDAFWTHGSHSVKFGGGVERIDFNYIFLASANGVFTFGSLAKFLTNQPSRLELADSTLLTGRAIRQTLFGLYVLDDWHARPNLTVNMGLRWEMSTVPSEIHGKLSNLINITDPAPHLGSPYISNSTLRNFEPRVGFSWDPFHNGKTAVRGGFGVFDVLPLPHRYTTQIATAFPFFKVAQVQPLPPGSFYTGAVSLVSPEAFRAVYAEQNQRNYVLQWNLNVQRELAGNLTGMVGYAGSRGVHQHFRVEDMNMVIPTKTDAGWLYPCGPDGKGNPCATGFLPTGTQASPIKSVTINPNFGAIFGNQNRGDSFYDALLVGVQKKMSHGVQLQGSYTWGKSIDNGSATDHGDQFGNSIANLPWYDLRSVRGVADFNIGRTLVINGTWQVPSLKSVPGRVSWITNGWQIGAIYKANDGPPFTAMFGSSGDPLGQKSSSPFDFPNRLGGPGCKSLVNPGNPNNYIKTECFAVPTAPSAAFYAANCDPKFGTFPQCFNLQGNSGRNILTGPGTSNLDFSVFKNNYVKRISENFNLQFRAEFFNILNRANFAPPTNPDDTDIFDPSGSPTGVAGLLTSTTTDAREIQFALKIIW